MKKLFVSLGLLAGIAAQAQVQGKASEVAPQKEGKVIYERTMQVRRPQNIDPELAARIPSARTEVFELLFGNGKSLYRAVPSADGGNGDISLQGPGGGTMMVRSMGSLNDETFVDLTKRERIDKTEQFGREFVVADSIRPLAWKFADETKTILGKTARKAYAQRIGTRMSMSFENGEMKRTPMPDTSTIVAWFTTEIPASFGPAEFQGQLPGLVLEVDVNNGRFIYKAVELSPKVSLSAIREPKGKRLTPAEAAKAREDAMAEMTKNMPAGMNIRVQN
ncbi:MAG: GLPGLI family protein [Chitinophagaceae bacterium]|nr:MAG: GLPGLI family protein [Chitinophagaceae bacterium]